MPNPFSSHNGGLNAPASRMVPVTPDDDEDLPEGVCRALLVGTAAGAAEIQRAAPDAYSIGVVNVPGYNFIPMTRMMWWTTPAPDIECVKG